MRCEDPGFAFPEVLVLIVLSATQFIGSAKAIVMRFAPSKIPAPGGRTSRVSGVLFALLLFATVVVSGRTAFAAEDAKPAQPSPSQDNVHAAQDHDAKQGDAKQTGAKPANGPETSKESGAPPKTPSQTPSLCDALGAAAVANELPVDFFTRLIWQESRFKPDAISRKGAEGIAQFMPATARASGLDNPFDPLEAITKSGQLLRDLLQEFGNLGLAAAAYNAGSGRVHDWLGGRRSLPRETRAYVRIVTGRSADEWATRAEAESAALPSIRVPCDLPATALVSPNPSTPQPKAEPVKPWGVEVVGGTTKTNALARYREWWEPKYAAIVAGREPQVVIRGIIGQSGAARVRIGDDTRAGAQKLCASLKAAGAYCDVMRN